MGVAHFIRTNLTTTIGQERMQTTNITGILQLQSLHESTRGPRKSPDTAENGILGASEANSAYISYRSRFHLLEYDVDMSVVAIEDAVSESFGIAKKVVSESAKN